MITLVLILIVTLQVELFVKTPIMFSHIVRVFLFVEIRIVFLRIVTFQVFLFVKISTIFPSNRDFAVSVHGDNTCAVSNRDFIPYGDLDSSRDFFNRDFAVFSRNSATVTRIITSFFIGRTCS